MNKLQENIEKLLRKPDRDELDERLLQMLQRKALELGRDPTEAETEAALGEVLKDHLRFALSRKLAQAMLEDDTEDCWDEEMDENADTVRSVFQEMDLRFWDYAHQKNVRAFELGISEGGMRLRMKVYLEADPRVCRIDAIYPFQADTELLYPLCQALMAENYPRRFGALQWDPEDGELSYRYSFPISRGLSTEDFRNLFIAVSTSAIASYDTVKQYATGRFRKQERDSIICKAQKLILELDQ